MEIRHPFSARSNKKIFPRRVKKILLRNRSKHTRLTIEKKRRTPIQRPFSARSKKLFRRDVKKREIGRRSQITLALSFREGRIGRKRNRGDIALVERLQEQRAHLGKVSNLGRYSTGTERSRYTIGGLIARTGTRNKGPRAGNRELRFSISRA